MSTENSGRPTAEWLKRAGIAVLPEGVSVFFRQEQGDAPASFFVKSEGVETAQISAQQNHVRSGAHVLGDVHVVLVEKFGATADPDYKVPDYPVVLRAAGSDPKASASRVLRVSEHDSAVA